MQLQFPWDSIVTIIVAVLGSTWFATWFQSKTSKKAKQAEEDHETLEQLKAAQLSSLHDRMYYLCSRFLRDGEITPEDYDNLIQMYEPYRALGGNGLIHKMMGEIDEMKFTSKEGGHYGQEKGLR